MISPQILHDTNFVSIEIFENYSTLNHTHRELEIIYVLKGKIQISLMNKLCMVEQSEIFLINSNEFHLIESNEDNLIAIIHINYTLLTTFINSKSIIFQRALLNQGEIRDRILSNIEEIITIHLESIDEYRALKIQEKTYKLCFDLTTILKKKEHYTWDGSQLNIEGQNERLADILLYLQVNYAEKISLEEIAKIFSLSVPYLSKFFKQKTGETFLQYLNKIRLQHAVYELTSLEKSLTRIAFDNGFPNLPSFNRVFQEEFNEKPNEFKKRTRLEINENVHIRMN